MADTKGTVSLIDLGKGALDYLPDLPVVARKLVRLATLTPRSKASLGRAFQQQANRTPHHPFLVDDSSSLTYGQAEARTNQLARGLKQAGVKPGETVGILSQNCLEVVLLVIACAKLGGVAALLNFNQRGEVLGHSLKLVKPKLLCVCEKSLEALDSIDHKGPEGSPALASSLPVYLIAQTVSKRLNALPFSDLWQGQGVEPLRETASVRACDPCFYIFTSGTTGLPKASVMSHFRWLQAMNGLSSAVRLNASDVFYCCLPLYHNNALTVSLSLVISAGASMAIDTKFSASRFWDRIRYFKATAFCYIGELLRYLLNQSIQKNDKDHGVRLITGNGLRPEIWKEFEDRFAIERIYEFYGASESNLGFMNAFGLRGTVGCTPIPYEIIEIDPETEEPVRTSSGACIKVNKGEVGLLISEVTSRRPFDGYTDKRANEQKLLRNVFKKGDVWLNSGDLVRRQGWQHIQFVDRLGDTFRWKGENVATSEVEGVISQLPFISQCAVYGVKVTGADGRAGMAAVVPHEAGAFNLGAFQEHVFKSLPAYAVPQYLRIMKELQSTGTHKIQKNALKKEGFDQALVSDPLYELISEGGQRHYRVVST